MAMGGFVVFVCLGAAVAWLVNAQLRDSERTAHAEITAAHGQLVLDQLSRASASTAALAVAMSGVNPDDRARFQRAASTLLKSIGGVSALAWAPDGTVGAVYPASADTGFNGANLLTDRRVAAAMMRARSGGRTVISGPFRDKKGHAGLIAIAPVLASPSQGGAPAFALARIELTAFLAATRLDRLPNRGQAYVLSETFAEAGKANIVAQSHSEALQNPTEVRIDSEVTHWVLRIAPRHERYAFAMHWALGIVLLLGMLVGRVLHAHLLQLVDLRDEFKGRRRAEQGLRDARRQLKAARDEINRHATQDGLTGTGGRVWFGDWLEGRWLDASRDARQIALLVFDVDRFGQFNEARGHAMGDACLRQIAGVLKEHLPAGDGLARLENDSFAVALLSSDDATARGLAARVVSAVAGLGLTHDPGVNNEPVTVSCGVATLIPEATMAPSECLRAAKEAMARALEMGGNRAVGVSVASKSRRQASSHRAVVADTPA